MINQASFGVQALRSNLFVVFILSSSDLNEILGNLRIEIYVQAE